MPKLKRRKLSLDPGDRFTIVDEEASWTVIKKGEVNGRKCVCCTHRGEGNTYYWWDEKQTKKCLRKGDWTIYHVAKK